MLKTHCVCLAILCMFYVRTVYCGYDPEKTFYTAVAFNDSSSPGDVFPDYSTTPVPSDPCPSLPEGVSYFLSEISIQSDGNVLVGAANKLYLLSGDLSCMSQYTWDALNTNRLTCEGDNTGSDQDSTCQNHVRVYEEIPTHPGLFLVCATQASVSPQCRTLRVSGNTITEEQGPIMATDAIISFYPEFKGFGEFITDDADKYFGIGFFQGDRGVGRDYKMAFYDVEISPDFTITNNISTVVADTWLKPPVTFVDYYRADYAPPTAAALISAGKIPPNPQPYNYQFYFVFIRESRDLDGAEVTYSQLVRICRNDPGVDGHFSSYMKARIFCMIEVPPGRDFIGANDFIYENIDSVAFNEEGRYSERQDWHKSMYGAFSGPRIGPAGTAICIYPAHNSREADPNAVLNRGIFDIFREDLSAVDGMEQQNKFVECEEVGRDADDSMIIDINQDVRQIGKDPLLVLDGITVTKMVVDNVCAVTSATVDSSARMCLFQDVLFLGTDDGTIIAVVFASVTENSQETTTPVFFDKISLENTDMVRDLRLEGEGADKRLYVSTTSRIYRLPLQRCSRYQNCSSCVGARNPYCAWDTVNGCVSNTVTTVSSGTFPFPDNHYQNVHTGLVDVCNTQSSCTVTATPLSSTTFNCQVSCNARTESVTFSASHSSLNIHECSANSLTLTNGQACATFSGGQGLQSYECRVNTSSAGPTLTAATTTSVGEPAPVSVDDVFAMSDRSSVEICLQLSTFTDYFDQYSFTVSYGPTNTLGDSTSPAQSLSTGNCVTVTGRDPGSTLYYSVNVMNSEGTQSSPVQTVQLLEDVPGPVTALTNTAVTATTVTLSWAQPGTTNGVITGYAVHVDGTEEISCVALSDPTHTVDGLSPFTSYAFSVSACTEAGEGSLTPLTVRTSCASPSAVMNVRYSSRTDTSLVVSWDAPGKINGDLVFLDYDVDLVCYDPVAGMDSSPTEMNSATTLIIISGLTPLTRCCATVSAFHRSSSSCSDSTRSPAVELCDITTDIVPGTVENLALTAIGSTSLYASWSPPADYQRPGLSYVLTLSPTGLTVTLHDTTSHFFDGLDPSTTYTVTITARSPSGPGQAATSPEATTLSQPPLAPGNPSLTGSASPLTLSWDMPGAGDPVVSSYTASLRCNGVDLPDQTTTDTSVMFSVDSVSGLAWCTAVVQASNDVGESEFSTQASLIRPATMPTKPVCFFAGNEGSNASISFTVTYPFSLNQLSIMYRLYSQSQDSLPSDVVEEMQVFSSTDPNVVFVVVERDSSYEFELQFCNENGCGPFCDRIFFNTVTTTPSPPQFVNLDFSDCCSANVRWSVPPNEQEDMVSYTLQITSSCTKNMPSVSGLTERSYTFTDLCAETEYSVAVQVTELQTNSTGVYSQPFMFKTTAGIPSEPRRVIVGLESGVDDLKLTVFWAVPETPNGTLVDYDIEWSSPLVTSTCGNYDIEDIVMREVISSEAVQFQTSNTSNIDLEGSILVCLRAKTLLEGEWAAFSKNSIPATAGLLTGAGTAAESCTNLIVVAVIASLAVLSSIVLGVVLILVVCYNGWAPLRDYNSKQEDNKLNDYAKNKRPPYNKTSSMMSTSSQAPMLRNGTISET